MTFMKNYDNCLLLKADTPFPTPFCKLIGSTSVEVVTEQELLYLKGSRALISY